MKSSVALITICESRPVRENTLHFLLSSPSEFYPLSFPSSFPCHHILPPPPCSPPATAVNPISRPRRRCDATDAVVAVNVSFKTQPEPGFMEVHSRRRGRLRPPATRRGDGDSGGGRRSKVKTGARRGMLAGNRKKGRARSRREGREAGTKEGVKGSGGN